LSPLSIAIAYVAIAAIVAWVGGLLDFEAEFIAPVAGFWPVMLPLLTTVWLLVELAELGRRGSR